VKLAHVAAALDAKTAQGNQKENFGPLRQADLHLHQRLALAHLSKTEVFDAQAQLHKQKRIYDALQGKLKAKRRAEAKIAAQKAMAKGAQVWHTKVAKMKEEAAAKHAKVVQQKKEAASKRKEKTQKKKVETATKVRQTRENNAKGKAHENKNKSKMNESSKKHKAKHAKGKEKAFKAKAKTKLAADKAKMLADKRKAEQKMKRMAKAATGSGSGSSKWRMVEKRQKLLLRRDRVKFKKQEAKVEKLKIPKRSPGAKYIVTTKSGGIQKKPKSTISSVHDFFTPSAKPPASSKYGAKKTVKVGQLSISKTTGAVSAAMKAVAAAKAAAVKDGVHLTAEHQISMPTTTN